MRGPFRLQHPQPRTTWQHTNLYTASRAVRKRPVAALPPLPAAAPLSAIQPVEDVLQEVDAEPSLARLRSLSLSKSSVGVQADRWMTHAAYVLYGDQRASARATMRSQTGP